MMCVGGGKGGVRVMEKENGVFRRTGKGALPGMEQGFKERGK